MKSDSSGLGELEKPIRQNIKRFLNRELEREYLPKHRNKALKLRPESLERLELSGEQLKARVLDTGKLFRVDITFPLFDLATDFTLVQCSCARDALSLEPPRCHHMYFVEHHLLQTLEALEIKEAEAETRSPLDSWESIWDESSAPEGLIEEQSWRLLLDLQKWHARLEKVVRPRYEALAWQQVGTWDLSSWREALSTSDPRERALFQILSRGAGRPELELFELLLARVEPANKAEDRDRDGDELYQLEDAEGEARLQILLCPWQLRIEAESGPEDGGYWLRPELGTAPIRRLIPGGGVIGWSDENPQLIVMTRLDARSERLVTQLLAQERPVPASERERMLQFLEKMDPRLLDLSLAPQSAEEDVKPVGAMQGVLRLTPFVRGGMKVELLLAIAPQLSVRPGEGAERTSDFHSAVPRRGEDRPRPQVWLRDFPAERRLARRLVRALDLEQLPEPEEWVYIAYNDQRALDLMQSIEALRKSEDTELLIEWPASLQKGPKPYAVSDELERAQLNVSVGEKKDWFQVEGWLELDEGKKISLREMLAALRLSKKYVRLPDGRWALISEHFRERIEPLSRVIDLDDDENCTIDLAALSSPEASAALMQFPFAEASKKFWQKVQRAQVRPGVQTELPKGLKAQLRPYQIEGYRWMLHLCQSELGACLADDMGLGKTVQTLAVLLQESSRGASLVIAPSSLSYNWAAEAQRFCPGLKVTLLRELEDRGQGRSFHAGEVVVASYGLIMRYASHLEKQRWNIIVLDEAQQIKNAQTKTAQAVRTLDARWKLGLTGTPIENRLSELWSLFHTLSPGLFGEWERFRRSYVFPIERDRSAEAQGRLSRKIRPFVLRRLKRDYLTELPEKTEVDLWVDLDEDEKEFYEALRSEALEKISALSQESEGKNSEAEGEGAAQKIAQQRMQVLAALTRLRQAACHRRLVDSDWSGSSSKIELLRERLSELSEAGHAALVFSQFTRFLREVARVLEADGRKVLYLDGQTPVAERMALVQRFQEGGYDAFLISLKAGGTGLNLTRASYVFHLDPWWNPAVEMQATDRAYRMGQKQAVTVYKLRARQTIEEVIHSVHAEKKELVESILAGKDPAEAWSWEAVWSLLRGQPQRSEANERASRRVQKPGPSREEARL